MERYQGIIDDWDAFKAAADQPPLTTVRRNPIKAQPDFEERLQESFPDAEQTDWNPNVYRLHTEKSPGKTMLHWQGEYYVQEESAAVPVPILNPQPGEKILDMAAAPGGKATQIAATIDNDGMVIANDSSHNRLQSLHANVYRIGAACIAATNYGGQNLPEDETYDRILLDAPCSGEGNEVRRSFKAASADRAEGIAALQKQLLEKASRLVEENGTIVYSTCTFAPEENEGVVQYGIEELGLTLEPVELEVPHQSGVTAFEEKQYNAGMRKAVRIFPHHLQSGGMFVAKLRG